MAIEQPLETLGTAIDGFLARADLAASSRRSYAQTLNRLAAELGAGREVGSVDSDELGAAVERAWGGGRRRRGIVMSRRHNRSSSAYGIALVRSAGSRRRASASANGSPTQPRRTQKAENERTVAT
jgi:hypothetical protein